MTVLRHSKYLTGPRLYLRPLEPDDLKRILPWFNTPELASLIGYWHPSTLASLQQWYSQFESMSTGLIFAVVLNEKDRVIGIAYLDDIVWPHRVARTSMVVIGDGDERGNGYGAEAGRLLLRYAFDTLGLNRVGAAVLDFNIAARTCLERLGFTHEGTQRQARFVDGAFYDLLSYGFIQADRRE